jgi:biotin carboxylase
MTVRVAFLESNLSGSGYEALQFSRRAGHQVVLVTSDLDYYLHAVSAPLDRSLLDEVVVCDTNDPAAVCAALGDVAPVDALLTMSELHVVTAAEAAALLGLAGSPAAAVRAARDKPLARQLCRDAGIPTPGFQRVTSEAEIDPALLAGPCVVKPVDGLLSTDVKLCGSADEARGHVRMLLNDRVLVNSRGQALARAALIEEYLDGPEYSVETLTWQGRTEVVAVTRKLLTPPPAFVEIGHAVPAPLPEHDRRACAELVGSALAAIGYDFGAAHVEIRLTAAGPRIIEINCRPAGDRITRLAHLATGVDLPGQLIGMYLGRAPSTADRLNLGAAIVFLPSLPGEVVGIEGLEEAAAVEGIVDLSVYVAPGTELAQVGDNTDRFGHVLAVGPDSDRALARAEHAAALLRIRTTDPALLARA